MENHIRKLRLAKGWTLQRLADEVQCSYQQIHKLEKSMRNLTHHWMIRLAKALECRPEDLIREPASETTHATGGLSEKATGGFISPSVPTALHVPFATVVMQNGVAQIKRTGELVEVSSILAEHHHLDHLFAYRCANISCPPDFTAKDVVVTSVEHTGEHAYYLAVQDGKPAIVRDQDAAGLTLIGALIWQCGKAL